MFIFVFLIVLNNDDRFLFFLVLGFVGISISHIGVTTDILKFKILFTFHTLPHSIIIVVTEDTFFLKLTVPHELSGVVFNKIFMGLMCVFLLKIELPNTRVSLMVIGSALLLN